MPAALLSITEGDPAELLLAPAAPVLRPARAADAIALHDLELRSFPGDRMSLRQLRFHLRSPRARLLVAELDGVLVGAATVLLRARSRQARLYSIAVDPQARGLGLGQALLAGAEQVAREAGAGSLHLEVRQDNRAAIRLYERRGYRRTGQRARYYDDGADAFCYARELCPPGS